MNEPVPSRSTERVAVPVPLAPAREIQELWLALSRRAWRSVVLVPTERRGSAAAAAGALAEVGRRLRLTQVGALVATDLDYDGAAQLVLRLAAMGAAGPAAPEQLVVAIPSVVTEPLGVAVARQADVVVLCIRLGRTGLADARRAIELIGPDRVAGCLVLV